MWIATALTGMEEDTQIPNRALDLFLRTTEERRTQLLQVARRITNGGEDAEDILQEAFPKAYKALPNFRGDSSMSTWLTAIVRNTAREYLRERRRRFSSRSNCSPRRTTKRSKWTSPTPGSIRKRVAGTRR